MITLQKFNDGDYECFAGVDTNDYFPDAFITWELSYHDYETAKNCDVCLILDAYGMSFDYSDHENEKIFGYTRACSPHEALQWLEKYDNDSTLELSDFLGVDWKPQTDNPEFSKFTDCISNHYAPNRQPME